MKKEYIMPRAYDLACEGDEMIASSLGVYDEQVGSDKILSREAGNWEDED